MSFTNPTPLQIGMTGTLAGRRFRVAGRVVMGMEEGGQTYYWSEFNLVSDDGGSATLVYEETERGAEWKVFTMFEPEYPMTAQDAATKRVGDPLNLEGTDTRVTLMDESRVYFIEGEAPEGVEVGDVAHYFNAEVGNEMVVVSWTGDEVEYYRGVDLPRRTVASAFGLRSEVSIASFLTAAEEETDSQSSNLMTKAVGAFLALAICFGAYTSCRPTRQAAAVVKTSAPTAPLMVGGTGTLNGVTYNIRGHALVEIAQVRLLYDRHEYELRDDEGKRVLLVYGLKPGAKDWVLFTPLEPLEPLTPRQAASKRLGETVNLNGYVGPVGEIFQSTIVQAEGQDLAGLKNGTVRFGFGAQSGSTLLLTRWNGSDISFYRGNVLPAKEVTAAFAR